MDFALTDDQRMMVDAAQRMVAADIAPIVAFLASPEGGWITGESIEASGGQRL